MKVCVISSTVFSVPLTTYGGLEAIAYYCARGLAERGCEVALVAPKGSTCPGVQIIETGPPGGWDEKRAYSSYWQRLPEFDVVVDHSWGKFAYLLKLEGRLPAPVLGVLHAPVNTMFQTLPAVEKPSFVCISDDQRAHFEALFGRPARTCYNGVDVDYYRPTGEPRTDRFLFLARFSTIKGADLALEACYRAGVGLDLVGDTTITGEPEYFARCKAMARRTSPGWDPARGEQFRVLGGVPRGETVGWYSRAHCLLHPNQRFREPFGLAPVEAMLCGCPVIAWDFGALRETVRVGAASKSSGRLVSSLDELVSAVRYAAFPDPVHDHERVADTWRKNCRENTLRFSVENMAARYHELVLEAAATGGW